VSALRFTAYCAEIGHIQPVQPVLAQNVRQQTVLAGNLLARSQRRSPVTSPAVVVGVLSRPSSAGPASSGCRGSTLTV
jgi:hypothetical protein